MLSSTTALMKTCTNPECGKTFPATAEYFYRDKSGKDGLMTRCKACINERQRQYRIDNPEYNRQYHLTNREAILERQQRRYIDNREKELERQRQYRIDNLEKVREQQRQYRLANPEKVLEQTRQWRLANPEKVQEHNLQYYADNREAQQIRSREYYADNQEARREYSRQWYLANPEKAQATARQYYADNREKIRQYVQANLEKRRIYSSRRLARKRGLPDTFTVEQWLQCLEYFNYCCPVCGNQLRDLFGNVKPHGDHWIPISYDGDDNPGTVATNMICLCNGCNLSKQAKLPDVWLKQKFGTRKAKQILGRIEAYFEWCEDAA